MPRPGFWPSNPRAFPVGRMPGVNYSHPAFSGQGPSALKMSAVATGSGLMRLDTPGLATLAGSPLNVFDGYLGWSFQPGTTNGGSGRASFTGTTGGGSSTQFTSAAIFRMFANPTANAVLVASGTNLNNGFLVLPSTNHISLVNSNSGTDLGGTSSIAPNVPYFIAYSTSSVGHLNFVLLNLHTGQLYTLNQSFGPSVNDSGNGTFYIGNNTAGTKNFNGNIAAACWMHSFMPFESLVEWALNDPWGFWYPPEPSPAWWQIVGTAASSLFANGYGRIEAGIRALGAPSLRLEGSGLARSALTGKAAGALTVEATDHSYARSFNGSSDNVVGPAGEPVNNDTGALSISIRFKTTSTAGGALFSVNNNTTANTPANYDALLYIEQTTGLLHGGGYTGAFPTLVSANPVNDGKWHVATWTSDGAATQTQTLYLDGVSLGSISPNAMYGIRSGSAYWYVGTGYSQGWPATNGGWFYFNGDLCDAAIWDTQLTAAQVALLVTNPAGSIGANANLIAYWPIVGQSPEPDESGNGYNAAVTGTSVVAGPLYLAVNMLTAMLGRAVGALNSAGNAAGYASSLVASFAKAAGKTAVNSFARALSAASGRPAGNLLVEATEHSLARQFNGSSDNLLIGTANQPVNNDTYALSISARFKTTSDGVLVSVNNSTAGGSASNFDPLLYVEATTGLLHGGGYIGSIPNLVSSSAVNDGKWHVAVWTSDGASPQNQTLYLDGVSLGSVNSNHMNGITSGSAYWIIGTGDTSLGGWPGTNNSWFYFNGDIADVAFWNTPLNATQVATLNSKPPNTIGANGNLIGYWPMLGQSPEPDLSGNGYNATVTGTTVITGPLWASIGVLTAAFGKAYSNLSSSGSSYASALTASFSNAAGKLASRGSARAMTASVGRLSGALKSAGSAIARTASVARSAASLRTTIGARALNAAFGQAFSTILGVTMAFGRIRTALMARAAPKVSITAAARATTAATATAWGKASISVASFARSLTAALTRAAGALQTAPSARTSTAASAKPAGTMLVKPFARTIGAAIARTAGALKTTGAGQVIASSAGRGAAGLRTSLAAISTAAVRMRGGPTAALHGFANATAAIRATGWSTLTGIIIRSYSTALAAIFSRAPFGTLVNFAVKRRLYAPTTIRTPDAPATTRTVYAPERDDTTAP